MRLARHKRGPVPDRRTLFDALQTDIQRNAFCDLPDLTNEASVETFFVNRLLEHLAARGESNLEKCGL